MKIFEISILTQNYYILTSDFRVILTKELRNPFGFWLVQVRENNMTQAVPSDHLRQRLEVYVRNCPEAAIDRQKC